MRFLLEDRRGVVGSVRRTLNMADIEDRLSMSLFHGLSVTRKLSRNISIAAVAIFLLGPNT